MRVWCVAGSIESNRCRVQTKARAGNRIQCRASNPTQCNPMVILMERQQLKDLAGKEDRHATIRPVDTRAAHF